MGFTFKLDPRISSISKSFSSKINFQAFKIFKYRETMGKEQKSALKLIRCGVHCNL